ncbi:EAL domain-containing protein [uncultured Sphingomonas sp.]|uniref:sensor domain-containing protein n=1 Tax=uncultured Sphingomonas sp. TaxID=158754 RepID=UPI0035C971D9
MDQSPTDFAPSPDREIAPADALANGPATGAVLRALPMAIYTTDAAGRLLFHNDAATALWGRRPPLGETRWCGCWRLETTGGDPVAPGDSPVAVALREGRPTRGVELVAVRPDGTRVPVVVDPTPLFDGEGRVTGAVGVLHDLTERKRVEASLRESERHYRDIVAFNTQIPWVADADGQVTEVSGRWSELTGLDAERALATGWRAIVHPGDLASIHAAADQAAEDGVLSTRFRIRTRDGDYRWVSSSAQARRDAAGAVVRWYGTLEDIHDRLIAEQARAAGEERLRLALRTTGLGVWDYDVRTRSREWSDELKVILGLPADSVACTDLYWSLLHPDDRDAVIARYHASLRGDLAHRFQSKYRILRADDGAERWVSTEGLVHRDAGGAPERVIVTVRDVTDAHLAQSRVLWAARHDALTGLANRALFGERLAAAVARGEPFGLLLVDLDHLKQVNDSIGHDGGDAVIRGAAERLVAAAARPDGVARLGGDEFGLILPGVATREALATAAEGLRRRLAEPLVVGGRALDTHASIGAALHPDHGRVPGALLKSADVALYAAKTGGRGRAELYDRRLRAGIARRAGMLKRARGALAAGRVEPHYQPKIDLATGRTTGFEALLRWRDATGRLRDPGDLAAAFEDHEVAAELSDRMLARVVADMAGWRAAGVPFGRIAVNVADAEFVRGDLVARVLGSLAAVDLSTGALELELTETVLLGRRTDAVADTLHRLAAAGVRVALDDFGTGYASLVHLRRFPIHVIKIDRSFTTGLGADAGAAAIVRALIGLSRDLGLETVAEGVETSTQFRWLQAEGCTLGQGYLFGRAQPAALVPSMLRQSATGADAVAC